MRAEAYRCSNCGAMLPISKTYHGICTCQSCDSEYRITDDYMLEPLKVEVCRLPVVTLSASQILRREDIRTCIEYGATEEYMARNLESLSRDLAKSIVPYMDVLTEFDPMYGDIRIHSRVKVAGPPPRRTYVDTVREAAFSNIQNGRYS